MNLKRLGRVLQCVWFFHFHINLQYRLNPGLSPAGAPLLCRHHLVGTTSRRPVARVHDMEEAAAA